MAPRHRGEDDLFFPGRGRADLTRRAVAICRTCPVLIECDDYQLRTASQYGTWAALKVVKGKRKQPDDEEIA